MINDSTFRLIKDSLRGMRRLRLLRLGTKLLCHECNGLRRVTDFFRSGEALLDCGHRRPAFFLDDAVAKEFKDEVEARKARREVFGFCQPTAGGYRRRFIEDIGDENVEIDARLEQGQPTS